MGKMRQPLNVSEGLQHATSLAEGTEWEHKLIDFKKKRGWKQFTAEGKKSIVRPKVVQGFLETQWSCTPKKIW
jgi:hypothetical protein